LRYNFRRCGQKTSVSPLFLAALLLLIFAYKGFAADSDNGQADLKSDYAEELIRSAREKKLYEERYWQVLLHYRKNLSGWESLIDDPRFFLSQDGKSNPQSELEATIRAFFRENTGNEEEHPICRFIARYEWLKEKLGIDASKLPKSECEKFDQVIKEVHPESASIVFPTYYMNSPASMFGHTLINIETGQKSKLLSHAVNYAAITDETNGLFFAVKGLFGFYKGYYSILPYYQKIQEYSDISQRDIWEYPLNLTRAEVRKLVLHLWELQKIYSDYYFFDENCSYNILFLLESARPSLNLSDRFSFWVLPIDTIKAMKKEGLIAESAAYRPSKSTKIKYKLSLLNEESRKLALDIVQSKIEPEHIFSVIADKEEQMKIADLAAEYIQYLYVRKKLSKEQYQSLFLKALKARSKLGKPEDELYDIPEPPRPDSVHESKKLSIAAGIREGESFVELGYRPVFSSLLDTDYGYNEGIQIEFGATKLRYYPNDNDLLLESLNFIDIVSVSPRDDFFKPYSWKANTGFVRKTAPDGEDSLVYRLNAGAGLAAYHEYPGLCYLFAEPELNIGGAYNEGYALGLGFSAGILKSVSPSWKCHLSARSIFFGLGDTYREDMLSLSQSIRIRQNNSITLDMSWKNTDHHAQTEAVMSWNIFF